MSEDAADEDFLFFHLLRVDKFQEREFMYQMKTTFDWIFLLNGIFEKFFISNMPKAPPANTKSSALGDMAEMGI